MLYSPPSAGALVDRMIVCTARPGSPPMLRSGIEELARRTQAVPVVVWVSLGFLISYLLFFIGPVFLRANSMQFFEPVAAADHLGIDLKIRLNWSAYSLDPEQRPLPDGNGTVFPPLANLLFAPLLGLRFSVAYGLLTVLTVLLYVFLTLWLPVLIRAGQRLPSFAVLICATGLMSAGFQFELERGQWNVIAVFLALMAVWIFHRHRRQRIIAYVLFVISVQLKIYPIVFVVLLVSDWRLWRENIIRLSLLAAANVLLFFVQGPRLFAIWISGLRDWSASTWIWEGNPSIQSAVTLAADFAARRGWVWLSSSAGLIQAALSLAVLLCLAVILVHAYRSQTRVPSEHYLLAAALGCLLIPGGAFDYRLSILGAPLILFLLSEEADRGNSLRPFNGLTRRLAILLLSFAYATTLVPNSQRPYYLANNFPALFVMLLLVTFLALSSGESPSERGALEGTPGASPA